GGRGAGKAGCCGRGPTQGTGAGRAGGWGGPGDALVSSTPPFPCLGGRAARHSFAPCWRPRFISALAPEDRCHLNGLGVRDGQVRYVTALGATNTPAGWRADRRGGVLMDVPSGEGIAPGRALPHSPRWDPGQPWLVAP